MTVRELIEALRQCPQDRRVVFSDECNQVTVDQIIIKSNYIELSDKDFASSPTFVED